MTSTAHESRSSVHTPFLAHVFVVCKILGMPEQLYDSLSEYAYQLLPRVNTGNNLFLAHKLVSLQVIL